jgi:hypothetical protein
MATITLSNNQLRLISQALELYARLGAAHFEVILSHPSIYNLFNRQQSLKNPEPDGSKVYDYDTYYKRRDAAEALLYELKKIITGKNLGHGGNLGIHNDILDESCREAFDMHQVIRNAFWKINPERSQMTVDSSVSKTSKSTTELIKVVTDE